MLEDKYTYAIQQITSPLKKVYLFGLVTMLFSLSFIGISSPTHAKANNKYAALIIDVDSGLILHRKNANKSLHPASLTKMMTLILTFDALNSGKLKLNSRIRISEHAASMIPSKLGLKAGSYIRIRDAIPALSVKSANDIAVALAEKLGGTEKNFAVMMTRKAKDLGMRRTRFRNASGLHDPRQVSTARDMARLGRVMVTDYKKYYPYFSKRSFTYKGKTYKSHNKLMNTYAGMDGLKTGYIRQSGFNLVSSAKRNNRRLVGVVLGGKTGKSRNAQMEKLLDQAFSRIGVVNIAKYDAPIPRKKPRAAFIKVTSLEDYASSLKHTAKINIVKGRTSKNINKARWAMLNSAQEDSMFNRMIGQGDYDINVRNRIETGLIAISAQLGEAIPAYISSAANTSTPTPTKIAQINYIAPKKQTGNWAIQIGAFSNRNRADKAITNTTKKLPDYLNHHKGIIAPAKTSTGWIYKSRLYGYTQQSAHAACKFLHDCISISPKS